jgi:TolB-like protein/Mg-chelatase subunit ChlD
MDAPNPIDQLPLNGPRSIDVAFVVDTTGSMGDEIRELQESLGRVIDEFRGPGQDIDVQFALVAFRDDGDEYVTRHHEFTSNIDQFRSFVSRLRAAGGGDIPERGDQALFEAMVKLSWRAERPDRARVIILCGDAAAHLNRARVQHGDWIYPTTDEWLIKTAQSNYMQIHSIACSGMSREGQAWFRTLAEASGGTYEDLAGEVALREELRRRHALYKHAITDDELAYAQQALPPGTRRVAVLPFRNLNGDEKASFLSDVLTDGIADELERQPNLAVSPRNLVLRQIRSLDFRDKSLTDATVTRALGKALGADLIITGSYFDFQNRMHLTGQAIDIADGSTLGKVEMALESGANLFETPATLVQKLLIEAKVNPLPVAPVPVPPRPATERPVTATKYFEKAQELAEHALRYHWRESVADPIKEKALSYVDRAIDHDPDFLEAYLLKASLCESLNRTDQKTQVLSEAISRARSLEAANDEAIRLAIEARYTYVVERDYVTAIRLYRQILDKYPTNLHALWQLANLLGGEWGCPPAQRDASAARLCIAKIMTLYPTSGMARYFEEATTAPVVEPAAAT